MSDDKQTTNDKSKDGGKGKPMTQATVATNVIDLPISLIVTEKDFNARTVVSDKRIEELAASIRRDGQMQPIGVEMRPDGKYSVLFGFMRLRAICGSKEQGGLGRDVIRATVFPRSENPADRLYVNLAENVAREDLTPFDLAIRCEYIKREYGESGTKIGNRIGKSVGYINNLVRAAEQCCKEIMERWQYECDPKNEKVGKICTTDWLNKVARLSVEEQRKALRKELGEEDDEGEEGEEGEGEGSGGESVSVKRAKMSELKKALAAAQKTEKEYKKAGDLKAEMVRGVVAALKFAMGSQKRIKGVYEPEEDDGSEE